jgi:hypothetical protein
MVKPGLVEVAFFFSAVAGWSHHFFAGEAGALNGDPAPRRVEQRSGEEGALDGDEGATDGDFGTLVGDPGTLDGDAKYML